MPSKQDLQSIIEDEKILSMRVMGMTPSQIAYQMEHGWDAVRVAKALDKMASAAVSRRNATVDEMHMISLARLEGLHQLTTKLIQSMVILDEDGQPRFVGDPGKFSSLISANIKILERVAKMLGLDKVQTSDNWLGGKTDKQILEIADTLGIDVSKIPLEIQ